METINQQKTTNFTNSYNDQSRADSYATLEFPNTYYLAYRDLPSIIANHVKGKRALDFGCGTGRSTRFLEKLGYQVTGVDISADMIDKALELDPKGNYLRVPDGDLTQLAPHSFDLILSVFTFDNIPSRTKRQKLINDLKNLLTPGGHLIMLDSTPELYWHEWASFSTQSFPQNNKATSGSLVKVIMNDVADKRPVEDIIWYNEDYIELFRQATFELIKTYKPLASPNENYPWVNETRLAPWVIYVVKNRTAVSTDKSKLDVPLIHKFISERSYWGKERSYETVEQSIQNSLCFGLYDETGNQLGFARIVTDYAVFAWLMDVFILEEHRGNGYGKQLMQVVMQHLDGLNLCRAGLGTADAHGLYQQYGFTSIAKPANLMEKLFR